MSDKLSQDSSVSVRPKVRTKKVSDNEAVVGEPIDKKSVKTVDKDGNQKNISALSFVFSEALVYVKFGRPPPNMVDISSEHQKSKELFDWIESVSTFEYNLRILLRLPMHRFWSTVIHEKGFHIMLESYLRNAPRFFDRHYLAVTTDQMKETIKRIHSLVFRLFLRLSCLKESKKDHISQQAYGQIIYDHYAFDIPKLLDLCTLYGNINPQITFNLKSIVNNVFQANNSYYDDLHQSVRTLISSCEKLETQLRINDHNRDSSGRTAAVKLSHLTWLDLQELLYFIADFAVSLSSLGTVFGAAANIYESNKLQNVIVNIYENTLPVLKKEVQSRHIEGKRTIDDIKYLFIVSQNYMLSTYREIVVNCCINPLLDENLDMGCKSVVIDLYLDLMTLATSEQNFSHDYFLKYSFENDLSTLIENSEVTGFQNVDQTRIDYFLNVLSADRKKAVSLPNARETYQSFGGEEVCTAGSINNGTSNQYDEPTSVDEVTLESYITSITDILPELGHGFIEQCLDYYKYDVEKVMDALLSDNLPDCLGKLSRKMERKLRPQEEKKVSPSIMESNTNPHTNGVCNEERLAGVDINSEQPEYFSEVHRGKRENKLDLNAVDKETQSLVKSAAFRIDNEERELEEMYGGIEYDDEYDDTYEAVNAFGREMKESSPDEKEAQYRNR